MALPFDSAQRLFKLGEFAELLRLTNLDERALRALAPRHRTILAHVLALTGDLDTARALALTIIERDSAGARSDAHLVLGLVAEQVGAISEAFDEFQLAVRLAKLAEDDEQIAWTQLRLFRHMLDADRSSVVTGMLTEVRRAVTRAATPHTSAYLHECVAVLEGQTGRLDEARRHCDIVDSLLARSPNAWLASGNLLIRASLAALDYRLREATGYIQDARLHIGRTANARASGADSTLGHLQVLTGQFGKAYTSLTSAINASHPSRFAALAGLEGLARLYLASGRFEECRKILERIEGATERDARLRYIYSARWATLTKAFYLLKTGRADEAVLFLERFERRSRDVRDLPLSAALHLTAAQALSCCGKADEASGRLLAASRAGAGHFRQLQGQYYLASAFVLQAAGGGLRKQLRRRAFRLWKQQGVISVPLEMRIARNSSLNARSGSSSGLVGHSAMSVVDSIAGLFELAYAPRLAGAELLAIIQSTSCSDGAELTVGRGDGSPKQSRNRILIPLGVEQGREIAVACAVPNDPARAVTLAAIDRLTKAALALERARHQESKNAALWPAERVEEQAGALFVGDEMQALLATARRVAPTTVPILITGETGTGKEVLARTIHGYSPRARTAFLPFNCTSTPRDMLDSQLFGHRRGSFTGAIEHFPGVIRAAAGGTLFLDEIGDMPLEAQPKLLRFLESAEVHPVGDTQPVRVDVRVIAATNANLDALVTDGRFREDLFYRLNIVRLHLPPLRERRMEIPALANHYLQKYAQEFDKGDLRLAEETMEYLLLYRWPGNLRQLANEMRRMAALCEAGAVLMPEHLSADIAASRRTIRASERVLDPTEVVVRLDQPLPAALEHVERAMLQYALRKCGGRMEETAALLGLSRKGLYLKRHRFGIEPPDTRTAGAA